MRIHGFAAHIDELFAGICMRLPKPRLFKSPMGWACVSPSVIAAGDATPAAAYERWKRGWLQIQAQRNADQPAKQDATA